MAVPPHSGWEDGALEETGSGEQPPPTVGPGDRVAGPEAILVSVAQLDMLLYRLLEYRLTTRGSRLDELLWDGAPLGSWESRIKVAYGLGLIDAALYRALRLARALSESIARQAATGDEATAAPRPQLRELLSLCGDPTTHAPMTVSISDQLGLALALLTKRLTAVHL